MYNAYADNLAWSYGFDGKLAKAPKYQELPSFDKSKNSLFKVHVHVDQLGFIWVNLDGAEKPSVPWEEFFAEVDTQPRLEGFNLDDYHFDHTWDMLGDYNWKTLADNYNEVRLIFSPFSCESFGVVWILRLTVISKLSAIIARLATLLWPLRQT